MDLSVIRSSYSGEAQMRLCGSVQALYTANALATRAAPDKVQRWFDNVEKAARKPSKIKPLVEAFIRPPVTGLKPDSHTGLLIRINPPCTNPDKLNPSSDYCGGHTVLASMLFKRGLFLVDAAARLGWAPIDVGLAFDRADERQSPHTSLSPMSAWTATDYLACERTVPAIMSYATARRKSYALEPERVERCTNSRFVRLMTTLRDFPVLTNPCVYVAAFKTPESGPRASIGVPYTFFWSDEHDHKHQSLDAYARAGLEVLNGCVETIRR